jgi:hypothetical protein
MNIHEFLLIKSESFAKESRDFLRLGSLKLFSFSNEGKISLTIPQLTHLK